MNKSLLARIVLGSVFSLLASSLMLFADPDVESSDLWKRSLDEISSRGLLFPGKSHFESYTLDNTGKSLRTFEAECRLQWNGRKGTLVSAEILEGDPKTRSDEKLGWKDQIVESIGYLHIHVPFFMDEPPLLQGKLSKTQWVNGVECVGFEFEVEVLGFPLKGVSWVDPETSLPKRVELQITNFEYKNEDRKVIHYYRTFDYRVQDGKWVPFELTESIWFVQRSLLKGALLVEENKLEFGEFQ